MSLKKAALLVLSGVGLFSVANYSAEVGTQRERKKVFSGKPFWVIAHRGFSGKYPENTMLAFEQAAALPIDALELDVHSSRDGKIVVIHDKALDRTTDRNGAVQDFYWDSLKKVDAGYMFDPNSSGEFPFRGKGVRIPLLEEVFQRFPDMNFVIEIKQVLPPIEEPIYRLIRKYRMEDKVIIASEHLEPLTRIRGIAPSIASSLCGSEAFQFYNAFRLRLSSFYRSRGDALQIPPDLNGQPVVSKRLVKAAHLKGMFVHIWTVNDAGKMKQLIADGVDGIITDFPDRLIEVTNQLGMQTLKVEDAHH